MAIEAVIESADLGPAYEGESFVLVTLRVPRDQRVRPGTYALEWKSIVRPDWSKPKDQDRYDAARERAIAATS